jgi:hypothetical protein
LRRNLILKIGRRVKKSKRLESSCLRRKEMRIGGRREGEMPQTATHD